MTNLSYLAERIAYCKVCPSCAEWSEIKGSLETLKAILGELDEINIKISDDFFGEVCDECNAHIEPAIHHWIDQFYKQFKSEIEALLKQFDTQETGSDSKQLPSLSAEQRPEILCKCGHNRFKHLGKNGRCMGLTCDTCYKFEPQDEAGK